ncbi:MAG: DUF1801 domain-containing protein, partial [Acidobacteria bacterium]|nr:DUF1801 domain-containing protein [Acidobacteriota bacterium]
FPMAEQTISYEQYLETLPDDRRTVVERVWNLVRENVGHGYTEHVGSKFLTYMAGEDWYVALANQKNYISLYLIPLYVFPEIKAKLDASGKKLQCGKSCINFKRAEDLPLEIIGEIVGAYDAEAFIGHVRQIRSNSKSEQKKPEKKKAAKK